MNPQTTHAPNATVRRHALTGTVPFRIDIIAYLEPTGEYAYCHRLYVLWFPIAQWWRKLNQ